MKNSHEDRYEKKLRKFLKKLNCKIYRNYIHDVI